MTADDFPVRIRLHLTESLRHRRRFDEAWISALHDNPPPSQDWMRDKPSVLDFMYEAFRRAYHGEDVRGGGIRPTDAKDLEPRAPVVRMKPRCHWGAGCLADAKRDERFCGDHLDVLHRIRDEMEGVDFKQDGAAKDSWFVSGPELAA